MLPFETKMKISSLQRNLMNSDKVLVRFVEDLMVLLVQRGVISTTDIPKVVVDNVIQRKQWRIEMKDLKDKLIEESSNKEQQTIEKILF